MKGDHAATDKARARGAAYALFFTSGAVALAQEVAWSEVLARTLGHGTAAVSAVAAVFLGGLAIGAAVGGRLAARSSHPLRLYGWLEIGVGAVSLVLALALPRLPWFTTLLGPDLALAGAAGLALRSGVAALCLLPATVLMGATLPPLVGWSARGPAITAQQTGRLAGVNAGGGAVGALAAVFLLLPGVGTFRTLTALAVTSLLVGLVAVWRGTRVAHARGTGDQEPDPGEPAGTCLVARTLPPLLLAAGAASLALQIAWTRVFAWMIGPSVYAFGVLLAVFVGGLGVGGLLVAPWARRTRAPWALFARLELALGASVILTAWLAPALPTAIARLSAATRSRPGLLQAGEAGVATALLLVPTALIGAAFPVACRLLVPGRGPARAVGFAGALFTTGNVLGALAAGFLLPRLVGARGTLLAAGVVFAGVGTAAAFLAGPAAHRARRVAPVLACLLAVWLAPAWEPELMASGPALNGPYYVDAAQAGGARLADVMRARGPLLFAAEGPDALVTVRALPGGGANLQINGKTEASTSGDLRPQILAAHVPLLHAGRAERVLVIGLASGVTAGSLLTRNPKELVVVEVSPTSVEAARCGAFDAAAGRPLDDPRTRLVLGDARSVLQHEPTVYDAIASQPSNPWVPGVAALYTREFFELARARLTHGGVFGQWVQAYGIRADDFRRILRTFAAVFPHCALYEESVGGGDYFLVGSTTPLVRSAVELQRRLTPAVRRDQARAGLLGAAGVLAQQVLDADGIASFTGAGDLLTDDRLRLAFTTPLTMLLPSARDLAAALERHRRPPADHLDLTGLPSGHRLDLLGDLARNERERRQDWQFLRLLDEDPARRLGTPAVVESLALAQSGRFSDAYGALVETLRDAPGPPALQILAGDIATRLGEVDLAVLHYRAALAAQPEAEAALLGLALALAGPSPAQARPLLESVLERSPGSPLALIALGGILVREGHPADALPILQEATRRAPELASGWSNLGVALRRLQRPSEAEETYRHALALSTSLAPAWYNLGMLLRDRGDEAGAVEAWRRGRAAAPDDCDLIAALAASPLVPPMEIRAADCAPAPAGN